MMHNIEMDDNMMTINIDDNNDNDCDDDDDDDDDEQIKIIQQQQQQEENEQNGNNNLKNKCFTIWPSLFRRSTYFGRYKRSHSSKRSFEQQQHRFGRNYSQSLGSSLNDDNLSPPPSSSLLLSPSSLSSTSTTSRPLSSSNVPFPITDKYLTPNSPISPRVKNFNLDMKILVLSRNDNPYLMKQLERSNSLTSNNSSITTAVDEQEYFAMDQQTTTTSHSALHTPMFNRRNYYRINNNGYGRSSSTSTTRQQHQQHRSTLSFTFDFDNQKNMNDNEKNLHEQLIRSPPPNFPEKLSHFLFTENLIKNL